MKKNNTAVKEISLDVLITTIGTFIFAFGIHYFTAPNKIAPGGVSGIATFLNYLINMPIGTITFVINVPILILGFLYLGKSFIFKTFLSIVLFTFFIDICFVNIPFYEGNRLLASLFGGAIMGTGLAIIFVRGGSTGGTDIVAKLTQLRYPHFSIGNLIMLFDCLVVITAVFVYRDIESGLYSTVCMFVSTKVIDTIIYGRDRSKQLLIITNNYEEVSKEIMKESDRGVTVLQGQGAYTGSQRNILLVCVRQNEFFKIKKIVSNLDPLAFMMISDVSEVLGEGFSDIKKVTPISHKDSVLKKLKLKK